jgi:hypothetical protein
MIVQYRGYWVSGSSIPQYDQGSSQAEGTVCAPGPRGSIIEVKRIEGPVFEKWEEAEEHALALCKTWLDGLAELFELWIALRPKSVTA